MVAHSGTLRVKSLTVSVSVSITSRISEATCLLGVLARSSPVNLSQSVRLFHEDLLQFDDAQYAVLCCVCCGRGVFGLLVSHGPTCDHLLFNGRPPPILLATAGGLVGASRHFFRDLRYVPDYLIIVLTHEYFVHKLLQCDHPAT